MLTTKTKKKKRFNNTAVVTKHKDQCISLKSNRQEILSKSEYQNNTNHTRLCTAIIKESLSSISYILAKKK